MKFLFDLFPVILFFAAFKFAGIYVATGVAIAATFILNKTILGTYTFALGSNEEAVRLSGVNTDR